MNKKRDEIVYSDSTPVRHSIRLPDFNYTGLGAYFVTICTYERNPLLGNISDGNMVLNVFGEIVRSCWSDIPKHFANTELAAYIIMPNHLHGIIVINEPVAARHAVPDEDKVSFNAEDGSSESYGKPLSGSLTTIIRSFKSAVTRQVNIIRPGKQVPFWQRGYYEHIIRGEKKFVQISEYILENPAKWELDNENPDISNSKSQSI